MAFDMKTVQTYSTLVHGFSTNLTRRDGEEMLKFRVDGRMVLLAQQLLRINNE